MKVLVGLIPAFALAMLSGGAPQDDDSYRVADITDSSGVTTHVAGLHYCFEEEEGSEVYINKYDQFFVQRGEALIDVLFKNVARIVFMGGMEEKGGRSMRKARILTRSGNEVDAHVVGHPGCFIKGRVDLGEFRVDLDKIEKMEFLRGDAPLAPGFETRLAPEAEAPEEALSLMLEADGTLRAAGQKEEPDAGALKKSLSRSACTVYLKTEADVPYAVFRSTLKMLREAGARCIYLGP